MSEVPSQGGALETAAAADFLGGQKLEDGIGLCLSGGGFRAMLFHLGAFVRMNELGLLAKLDRVASVSGGSLAAGALAVAWDQLTFDQTGVATNLIERVAEPILNLSSKYVDIPAIALGFLPFVHASELAALAYDHWLFRGKTLQDLPTNPRFSFTATSLQSGVLWRFARDYAADYRVGMWRNPSLRIASVVAASAAFPPYLSPAYIDVPPGAVRPESGADLHREPYTTRLCLTDGGVYDNLGLEPIWKRYKTILVSDGGAIIPPSIAPRTNWLSLAVRASNIALQQGVNMRRRVLFGLERTGERRIAYWGIGEPVASYGVGDELRFTAEQTRQAAEVPTRLTKYPLNARVNIVRAGYAHADAALRASRIPLPVASKPDFSRLPDIR
ncbi:patatin-like phospholipase family protein [Bradyrhizobium liaoningense]|uniref:patatin-like phospholipase family protein n=1 Tax=Bradyrhizobium liaoningense TaxID=43992 RepID=UPI001BA48090|nr:patatin-like phospholipase family protein [Bradyrhizobium liaoningense]MBR0716425.1 patatin-like phospholipase family protein [Bradyrhizobium liaoningense]